MGSDGRLVATSGSCRVAEIEWGETKINCVFFKKVNLSPPVLFEHLAGTGLAKFLNGAGVILGQEPLGEGLRYVHGRSEVMRGRASVTSVLLAKPEPEDAMTFEDWVMDLPQIYRKFLEKYGSISKIP